MTPRGLGPTGGVQYFPLLYKLRGRERYLLWVSNDKTAVAMHTQAMAPSFATLRDLRDYARLKDCKIESGEPKVHDLDWVADWLDRPTKQIDAECALLAWNLFSDLAVSAHSSEFLAKDAKYPTVYKKLFFGNNLPSMTPAGRRYIPRWSREEVDALADVLGTGLNLFESVVRDWPESATGPTRKHAG